MRGCNGPNEATNKSVRSRRHKQDIGDAVLPCSDGNKRGAAPHEPTSSPPTTPPFPVEVFPASVASFVRRVEQAVGCPPDFPGVAVLAAAGAAIGATRAIEPKPGWREQPNLYVALVGRPGSGKSPGLQAV